MSSPAAQEIPDPTKSPQRAHGRWTPVFWLAWVPAALAIVGLLFLLGYSMAKQSKSDKLGVQAVAGSPARDFAVESFDGGTLQLSAFKGQPVLVNFWASWCIPCREEAPTLERTWKAYKDRGVIFVGVNIWDKEADARTFLKQFSISYPNGMDPDGRVAIDYGVRGVPESFFVERSAKLTSKYVGPVLNAGSSQLQLGAIDPDFLSKQLEELLR